MVFNAFFINATLTKKGNFIFFYIFDAYKMKVNNLVLPSPLIIVIEDAAELKSVAVSVYK